MDQATPDSPLEPAATVELRRPPFWSFGMLAVATAGAVLVAHLLSALYQGLAGDGPPEAKASGAELGLLFVLWLLFAAVMVGRRVLGRKRPLPPIRFRPYDIELPGNVNSSRTYVVPYTDIISLHLGGYPPQVRVLLESRQRLFVFQQPSFVDPAGPELVYLETKRRLMRLPEGRSILEAMRQQLEIVNQAVAIRPWATQILLGALWIIFINQWLMGATDHFATLAWGGNSAALVWEGELYRLLSANFLHLHMLLGLHIVMNSVALYSLGGAMERILGWERFILVYLLSGLGTTLASVLFTDAPVSAGASGCILGLFGGLAAVNWRYRTRLPLGFRQTRRWWIVIIGINVALVFVVPLFGIRIDIAGHLGGFLIGAVLTHLLLERGETIRPAPSASYAIKVAAVATIAMFAVGLGTAVWFVKDYDEPKRLEYISLIGRSTLAREEVNPAEANELAWYLAIHPGTGTEQLALAEDLALRATTSDPFGDSGWLAKSVFMLFDSAGLSERENATWAASMAYNDTLATVYYRQGRYGEAAALQGRLIEARPEGFSPPDEIWSQYERFLAARFSAQGAITDPGVDVSTLHLAPVRPDDEAPYLELNLTDELRHQARQGLTVLALVWRGQQRTGLLRIGLGPNPGERYTFAPGTKLVLIKEARVGVAAVKLGSVEKVPEGGASWTWYPTDPVVAGYP